MPRSDAETHAVVHLDGRFVEPDSAMISLFDRGYLLGEGVFATMRGYDGAVFRPHTHLGELERGAVRFGFGLPSLDVLADKADELAGRTAVANAYVRVTATAGVEGGPATVSICARPMRDIPTREDYATGVTMVTVTPRRIPPACFDGTLKTTSYAAQVLARREAREQGKGEGLQLTLEGDAACGTMSNVFLVQGDTLRTPSLDSGCRDGVTRRVVLEMASQLGWRVVEERIPHRDLMRADGVFVTSTRVECLPIRELDGVTLGGRAVEVTERLRAKLGEIVRREASARSRPHGT